MPEISIIVAIYNVEKYLQRCVDSILNQTFSDFEIILVDDGSTDGCGVLCDVLAAEDRRINVIHKKNGGLSSARNAGIDIAKGKYLAFIDGDDYIALDMYELLYRNLCKEEADISVCGIFHCYKDKLPSRNAPCYKVLDTEEAIYTALEGKLFGVNAVNKLYKKEIFKEIRYPEGKVAEDAFVIVDILMKCNRLVVTSEQKYYYFHREGSITSAFSAANCFDCIRAYKRNCELINLRYPQLCNIAKSRLCWSCFYALDRLTISNDEVEYLNQENRIIRYLRMNTAFVLFKSKVTFARKLSAIVLLINKKWYKKIVIFNHYKNLMPNS